MKHFTLLVFLTFTLLSSLNAQWESLGDNIIPDSYRVWSLKLAPDHSIWAISTLDAFPPTGETPKIHRSADEGVTWINSEVPAAVNTYGWDISPIDSMNAFIALDNAGLYQTADGGVSWAKVDSFLYRAFYVHFFNINEGWVLADSGGRLVMCVTSDGGNNWTYISHVHGIPEGTSLPPSDLSESVLPFTYSIKSSYDYHEETILLGTTSGKYWQSTDKGYNWVRRESPLADLGWWASNVSMKDSTTFMLAGDLEDGTFATHRTKTFATTDGGETWIEGEVSITAAATQYIPGTDSVFIISNHNNFGWGGEGTVITYDYGANWERIDFGTRILAMDFIDQNTGIGACCNHSFWNGSGPIFKWDFELPTANKQVINAGDIRLSPNPVSSKMQIEIREKISGNQIFLNIISANGQVLRREQYPNQSQLELDVTDLPKGFYLLKIRDKNKAFSRRFIKI